MRLRAPLLLLAALALGLGLWFLAGRDRTRATRGGRPAAPGPAPREGAASPPDRTEDDGRPALEEALREDPAPPVATRLRFRIRTDPAAARDARSGLLDPATPRETRMVLALVLGTLPGHDDVLLEALAAFGDDVDVARCLVWALGATREPLDDDEVFELGDRPWGVTGPGGIGITVCRFVEDPTVRDALGARLAAAEPALREAAAVALRHSLAASDTRSRFLSAVRAETDDDAALVLGEALAVWAGGGRGAERDQVVDTLLARARDTELSGFRFRLEDDFARLTLTAAQADMLADYAGPAHPFELRSFALSALAAAAPGRARTPLEQHLREDRDAAVRDLCARLLGTLPETPESVALLERAAREDPAWNVRYQALEGLARFGAVEAVRAAQKDEDARVAEHARVLLSRLEKGYFR